MGFLLKHLLRILLVIGFVGLLGLGVMVGNYFRNFNPNDLRPFLESKILESSGFSAELGNLSLGWKEGLNIRVESLRLKAEGSDTPLISSGLFFIRLDPFGLIQGKLVLNEVNLMKPEVSLVRASNGTTNWQPKPQSTQPPKPSVEKAALSKKSKSTVQGFTFLLSKLKLDQGEMSYTDEVTNPPFHIQISRAESLVEQQALEGKVQFKGRGQLSNDTESDLSWEGSFDLSKKKVNFHLHLLKEQIRLEGEAYPFLDPPNFRGGLQMNGLDLAHALRLIQSVGDGRESLTGTATGKIDLQTLGFTPEQVKGTALGGGELEIRDGSLRNINFVDSLLRKITIIPGLQEVLVGVIPPAFQPLFRDRDTRFELLQINFKVENQRVQVSQAILKGSHFAVQAQGNSTLAGELDFEGELILSEEFSRFLIGRVNELSHLRDLKGQIRIPFVYRGGWRSARPIPKVASLAEDLIATQGQKLLEKGLEVLSGLSEKKTRKSGENQ